MSKIPDQPQDQTPLGGEPPRAGPGIATLVASSSLAAALAFWDSDRPEVGVGIGLAVASLLLQILQSKRRGK
jgi:hypothetical protein